MRCIVYAIELPHPTVHLPGIQFGSVWRMVSRCKVRLAACGTPPFTFSPFELMVGHTPCVHDLQPGVEQPLPVCVSDPGMMSYMLTSS